mmetsp:Transcript_16016/g.35647  ORF Transcript_16016/g.35647 Transcript_16016/m.35647 type:complete len:245 (-) Transcript_16016:224-958(-)
MEDAGFVVSNFISLDLLGWFVRAPSRRMIGYCCCRRGNGRCGGAISTSRGSFLLCNRNRTGSVVGQRQTAIGIVTALLRHGISPIVHHSNHVANGVIRKRKHLPLLVGLIRRRYEAGPGKGHDPTEEEWVRQCRPPVDMEEVVRLAITAPAPAIATEDVSRYRSNAFGNGNPSAHVDDGIGTLHPPRGACAAFLPGFASGFEKNDGMSLQCCLVRCRDSHHATPNHDKLLLILLVAVGCVIALS